MIFCCLFAKSCPTLHHRGVQHSRLLIPSLPLGVCTNSCPLSGWCYPIISSSAACFSFCLQSFPTTGSFPKSQPFPSGGQSIRASASASVLPKNIKDWFLLGLTGLIPLQSKGLSRVLTHWFKHYMFSLEAWYLFLGYERNVFC